MDKWCRTLRWLTSPRFGVGTPDQTDPDLKGDDQRVRQLEMVWYSRWLLAIITVGAAEFRRLLPAQCPPCDPVYRSVVNTQTD